jgi:signal transduction histidine kinase
LAQVLLNLIRNSLYEIKDQENSWIRVEFRETYIDIVDSGPGIDPETQRKIMTPFYTTKENSGTGLGLPLCASLMKQMGGDFIIPSQQDHATFRLILPGTP